MLAGDVSVEVEVDGGDVEVVPAVLELDDVMVVHPCPPVVMGSVVIGVVVVVVGVEAEVVVVPDDNLEMFI